MARVSLAPYSLRLSTGVGDTRTYYLPNELPPAPGSTTNRHLRDVIDGFLTEAEGNYFQSDESQKMLGITNWERTARTALGLFRSGEWGYGSLLIDAEGTLDDYSRVSSQAELLPFFFAHHYAPDRTQSILLLQKFKQFGILGAFQRAFKRYLEGIGMDVRVEIEPLVPGDYVAHLLDEGRLRTIQFIKHVIPGDVVEQFEEGTTEVPGSLVVALRAGRASSLPFRRRIREWIGRGFDEAEQVQILGEDFDEVKFTVKVGGTERTITLTELHAIRPAYDVSDEVELGDDGHPTWESIQESGVSLLTSLRTSLWQTEDAVAEDE